MRIKTVGRRHPVLNDVYVGVGKPKGKMTTEAVSGSYGCVFLDRDEDGIVRGVEILSADSVRIDGVERGGPDEETGGVNT